MQPEKDLRSDHAAIRRGVKTLEQLTSALREGHAVQNTDLYTLIDNLEEAANGDHREKEENAVFDMLRGRDVIDTDALGLFRETHDDVDRRLGEIRELVGPAAGGDKRARRDIAKQAERFGELTREHLRREEDTFVDDLDSLLNREELDELESEIADIQSSRPARERLEERIQRLQEEYEEYL